MHAKLKINHVGPSVSVQDKGRPGHLRFGVTTSGAMDRTAYAIANAALGNDSANAALEISLGGVVLECIEGSVSLAIVGGSFSIQLNEEILPAWTAFTISAGDTLKVRPGAWGSWCYLAIAGMLESPQWLGSYSVHLNSGICGRPCKQDDVLSINNATVTTTDIHNLGDAETLMPANEIRAVIGPQDRFFEPSAVENLFNSPFTVSAEYDRMGMRLHGCTLPINAALDMPSEPISRGSLQVPGHGDPICLMADHHTAGGYPKIATVISADQDVLAQHRSGDTIHFVSVTTQQAIEAARDGASQLENMQELIQQNKVGVTEKLWKHNLISGAVDANQ